MSLVTIFSRNTDHRMVTAEEVDGHEASWPEQTQWERLNSTDRDVTIHYPFADIQERQMKCEHPQILTGDTDEQ